MARIRAWCLRKGDECMYVDSVHFWVTGFIDLHSSSENKIVVT